MRVLHVHGSRPHRAAQRGGAAPPGRRRLLAVAAGCAFLSVIVGAQVAGAASAAADTNLSCPGGSYNLCIPGQGANEGVTGTAGSVVVAGYDFTVPGSGTTTVMVLNAYEQLTVSCANHTTPTQPTISVPMPNATYTAPFQSSQGWVPTGDQSSTLSYEGSLTLPNLCGGGTIDVGQPGQMLFAAQVESNGASSLNFRSHYNDGALSKSGSWSATKGVTPTPIGQTIAGHIYLCNNGTQTTTEVSGGTLGATGPQTVPTQPNPLGPVSVAAGSYTMTETSPSGYELASACGTTSSTQTVTVPSGGAGVGIFYVTPVSPGLTITKTVCNDTMFDCASQPNEFFPNITVPSGTRVIFMISVTNTGPVTLYNVTTNDNYLDCGVFVTGILNPGQTDSYLCGDTDDVTQSFSNTATATGVTSQDVPVTSPPSTATVTVTSGPSSLTLTKTVCNDTTYDCVNQTNEFFPSITVPSGTRVIFMITIKNTGGTVLSNVTVNDSYLDCGGMQASSLAPGQTFTYFCGDTDNVTQSFTNTASATATTPSGPTVNSATSTATVTIE